MDGGLWHCTGDRDQDHPQEKEMQNGCLRRPYKQLWKEVKSEGEKERYTHLNTEFQRIAEIKKPSLVISAKK